MSDARIRGQIALMAARLMYAREESEYFTAKRKAARQLGVDHRVRPKDLPSNAEIREQIGALANLYEGESRQDNLRLMRIEALRLMRLLNAFHPRLIGSVLTGHIRQGSDIDIHVFSDHPSVVTMVLEDQHLAFQIERKRVIKENEERLFTHIHVMDRFNVELTLYEANKRNYPFKSSITGRLIERATIAELRQLVIRDHPNIDPDADPNMEPGWNADAGHDLRVSHQSESTLGLEATNDRVERINRFEMFRLLLQPLAEVRQNPAYHPEGDALYHSLQVFELARREMPWDEEFLLAALLHDVGKAIDPSDHVAAGLAALEGMITPRTQFLIAHHMDAHAAHDGSIGHRAKQRLRASPDYDDLMLLHDCDVAGRRRGMDVCEVAEALEFIRQIDPPTDFADQDSPREQGAR